MQYPVNLSLAGRRCLLVGGGRVALRKAAHLLACGADLVVVAPQVHADLAALAAAGAVEWHRRPFRRGDIAGHRLVVTATGDPEVDQQVFDEAERLGVWVNSADDPARCTFTLPAVVRQGPVMVTASTGGASPALSSWLRERLEALVGPEFAEIAAVLAAERARVHAAGGSTEDFDWRPLIDQLATEHGVAPALRDAGLAVAP